MYRASFTYGCKISVKTGTNADVSVIKFIKSWKAELNFIKHLLHQFYYMIVKYIGMKILSAEMRFSTIQEVHRI